MGVLGVTLFGWRLILKRVTTKASFFEAQGEFPAATGCVLPIADSMKKRRYPSGAAKRNKSGSIMKKKERIWRRSPRGRALKLNNMAKIGHLPGVSLVVHITNK